ncbi:hypothetical protein L9F63_000926, partial [Diploptera punctata]
TSVKTEVLDWSLLKLPCRIILEFLLVGGGDSTHFVQIQPTHTSEFQNFKLTIFGLALFYRLQ